MLQLIIVIIKAYLSVINYTENFIFHLSSTISYTDEIVGNISLDFNVLDQLLIRYFAFVMLLRRSGNMMWLFIHIHEAHKPV